jgi:microcystin degradation protein MlrC/CubicO group peptidase (beta-lactamase class C family)
VSEATFSDRRGPIQPTRWARRIAGRAILLLAALGLGCAPAVTPVIGPAPAAAPPVTVGAPVYPGAAWERAPSPEAVGWSSAALESVRAELSELPTTGFMAVAGGRVFFEYGDLEAVSYLASVRKSILSMLFGNYVADGTVRLDRTLAELGIDDHQGLTDAERRATIRHLLSARSGVYHPASNSGDNLASAPPRGSQEPGAYYLYSNWDFNALGTIFEQETGRNLYDALETDLARPVGMQDFDRALHEKSGDLTRSMHPAYHIHLSTRDMARLGYLMLREGTWDGRQLVPRDWVQESTSLITPQADMNPESRREAPFGYGYLWWVFDSPDLGPEYDGAYAAHGMLGQHILVVPALDLVVAHKTAPGQGRRVSHEEFHAVARRLIDAHCGARCLAGSTAPTAAPAATTRPVHRVAVARFSHETCTFCPGGDTEIADWLRTGEPQRGEDLLLRGGAYVRGFVDQARDYGDVELIGLESPRGVWGGSSRSWNTEETFDHFVGRMLDDLRTALPVDGVYLALHGAMAVRNVPRPEAEIARRFREVVGPGVPIVAAFDLHGNEDAAFLRWADGAFVTKRFPHYDAYRQGQRAARYVRSIMRGDYTPATATRKPPILTATVVQWTGASPVMDIMERARRWEDREPGAFVSVFLGFPWSDVPDLGATVHVMTNGDQALADRIADDMAAFMWRVRSGWAHGSFPQPAEAVGGAAQAIADGRKPVVLADYWDRPGDATWTLQALLDRDVARVLVASLTAEPTLDRIWERGLEPGQPFDDMVGGYTGEQAGPPVHIRGTLRWKGAAFGYDRVAVIDHGQGSTLILVPAYHQVTTPGSVRAAGVEPDDYDVFVLKTRVHFRRGFDETGYAPSIFIVDAPGNWFGTTRLEALEFENVDIRGYYPFGAER